MEIVLNGFQKAVYKGKDMERWGTLKITSKLVTTSNRAILDPLEK